MTPPDPAPSADRTPVGSPVAPVEATPLRPGRLWALALGAALAAGLASWLVGEATVNHFVPKPHYVTFMGMTMNRPSFRDRTIAETGNVALAYGGLGAALGLALGLAGGLSRGSGRSGVNAALLGLILGGASGAAASAAVIPVYHHRLDVAQEDLSRDMVVPFLIHAGIWSALGAASGVAYGLGLGTRRRVVLAAMGGLAGGLLGAGLYEVIGALAFPTGKTSEPLAAEMGLRILARLAVSIPVAALAVLAVLETRRSPAPRLDRGS